MNFQKKTHIAFVAPTIYRYYEGQGFGGAELQIVQLSKMFTKAGYQVTILTNDFGQKAEEVYDGVTVLKAPLRFLGGSDRYFLPDSVRFIRQLVKLSPDFCFIKVPNAILFHVALAAKISKKIKPVKIFASDADCIVKGKDIPMILYRLGVRWTDRFIFQTQHQQQMTFERLGKRGPVIRNIFIPPEDNIKDIPKDLDILWVGSFDKNKYPEGFYEVAKALPQYRFGMIAKNVPPRYQELQSKIVALSNVKYFGQVPFQETQRYFARSRAYLCTSTVEGFPNTFLQAWWSKLPVVSLTFPCDGLLEQEGVGLLSGTMAKLCTDLTKLLSDEAECQKIGLRGYEYLQKSHLPEMILKQYRSFMDEIR